jgi:RPC5 protein
LDSSTDILTPTAQKLLLLQYPAHRPAVTPYNARNLQKPSSLRIKPSTGLLEVDIPIDTKLNYNFEKGLKYAASLKDSRVAKAGGTHGLSGGFNTGPVSRNVREEDDDDVKNTPEHPNLTLGVQTLGGKIVKPSSGDPIYLLGSFYNNTMHLSHLDALVQVRPQLPHLDAADELERDRGIALARAKGKDGAAASMGDMPAPPPAGQSARPESKAIDIKLKSNGPANNSNDLSTNANAKLLRAVQQEPWQTYEWIDEDEAESHEQAEKTLHLFTPTNDLTVSDTPHLQSAITNSEWLDLMSVPRVEHGKKGGDRGLMGKVRGREREKQRRKRNEAARRERATTAAAAATHNGATTAKRSPASAAMDENGNPTTSDRDDAHDTADDEDGGDDKAGPSDEDSSEDDDHMNHHHHHHHHHGDGANDVEMLDTTPNLPQIDGADASVDDEVREVPRPDISTAAAAATAKKRGRERPPKKSTVEPIVLDD